MKRTIATLMMAVLTTIGLTTVGSSDAEAKHWNKKKHHHHHHWNWDDELRHRQRARRQVVYVEHVHDAHCGHGYYDRYGVFHLYAGNGLFSINFGTWFD